MANNHSLSLPQQQWLAVRRSPAVRYVLRGFKVGKLPHDWSNWYENGEAVTKLIAGMATLELLTVNEGQDPQLTAMAQRMIETATLVKVKTPKGKRRTDLTWPPQREDYTRCRAEVFCERGALTQRVCAYCRTWFCAMHMRQHLCDPMPEHVQARRVERYYTVEGEPIGDSWCFLEKSVPAPWEEA